MKDSKLYLIHISECIERIEGYVADGREAFMASSLTQDAVLRNLQTLAESTQRLPQSLKDTHPAVVWRKIAGFRNVLVHDYLAVDIERVWEIVERDLPDIKRNIEAIRQELGGTV